MPFSFHWIPARNSQSATEALNEELRTIRVLSVERQLCAAGVEPGWAICIEYVEGRGSPSRNKQDDDKRIDYRNVLDPDTFRVFAALRSWRKEVGDREKVPVYTILTNEQLAEIARRRCSSLTELEAVEGIGAARIKKYGPGLLSQLKEGGAGAVNKKPEASKQPS